MQYPINNFLEGPDTKEDTKIELVIQLDDSFTSCNRIENVIGAISSLRTRFGCDIF